MGKQQSGQNQRAEKSTNNKPPTPSKPIVQPEQNSPMDKFNSAMRKILSVPKKGISKK